MFKIFILICISYLLFSLLFIREGSFTWKCWNFKKVSFKFFKTVVSSVCFLLITDQQTKVYICHVSLPSAALMIAFIMETYGLTYR